MTQSTYYIITSGMDFSVKTASLAGALIFLVVYISFKRSESWEPTDSSATPAVGAAAAGGEAQHEARYIFDINDPFSKSFVDNFEAANPAYTEDCKAYMRSPQEFNQERKSYMNWKYYFSQWQQDYVMFINVFFDMAARGKKGFYIESGAHDYIRVSNTVPPSLPHSSLFHSLGSFPFAPGLPRFMPGLGGALHRTSAQVPQRC